MENGIAIIGEVRSRHPDPTIGREWTKLVKLLGLMGEEIEAMLWASSYSVP
ncbi:unnamed protein product [marine sediment metagenome]|uniref:Uncharacterized protein n=1 Tax=marine sediment metagenome TaxID=412755 RepID=X1NC82_9ZZZZ